MNWNLLFEDFVNGLATLVAFALCLLGAIWMFTFFGTVFIIQWLREGSYFYAFLGIGFNLLTLIVIFQKRYKTLKE